MASSAIVNKLADRLQLKEGQLTRYKEQAKTTARRFAVGSSVLAGAAVHGAVDGLVDDPNLVGELRYTTALGVTGMLASLVDDDPKDMTGDIVAAMGGGMVAPELSKLVSRTLREMKNK